VTAIPNLEALVAIGSPAPSKQRRSRAALGHAAALVAALLCWAASLRQVDLGRMSDLGLISVLPALYFVSLGVLCVGLWYALRAPTFRPSVVACYLLLLLLVLHGTVPVLYQEPHYAFVYKHFGVAAYIDAHGSVDRSVDIYQNWPGFFSALAILSHITGTSPLTWANWAQPFFSGLDLLAVCYVARGLTRDPRRIAWSATLFLLADWVGQNYLSPEAFGFLCSLTALGIVLNELGYRARARRQSHALTRFAFRGDRLLARWKRPARRTMEPPVAEASLPGWLAVSLVLLISAAVVVSHQLSPFFLIGGLTALVIGRRCRFRWLPVAVFVMTVAWVWLALPFLSIHFVLFSTDIGANSGGVTQVGSIDHQWVGSASRALSVFVWVFAVCAFTSQTRRRPREGIAIVALLALVPAAVILVQSYGGEAIYRVYLFSLPWCCCLIAGSLVDFPRRRAMDQPSAGYRRRVRAGLTLGLVATMAPLLLVAHFGYERANLMPANEVAVTTWFESHHRAGSILTFVVGNWPIKLGPNYNTYRGGGTYGGPILSQPQFQGRLLGPTDVPLVVEWLRGLGAPDVYVALGPAEEAYAEGFGLAPPGAVSHFQDLLLASPAFQLVHRDGDAALLELRQASSGSH
jgi:hypothetical protein